MTVKFEKIMLLREGQCMQIQLYIVHAVCAISFFLSFLSNDRWGQFTFSAPFHHQALELAAIIPCCAYQMPR